MGAMNLKILNSRERKQLLKQINSQFGSSFETDKIIIGSKDKIYLLSQKFHEVPDKVLYYYQAGLYIASYMKDGIRLTIEGAQLFGKTATKNIIELNEEQLREWIKAYDLYDIKGEDGFYLVKYKTDFYATAKLKEGRLHNYIPKGRKLINILEN